MTPNVRFYPTEQAALDADARLAASGFTDRAVLLPSNVGGTEEKAVREAIREGKLPQRFEKISIQSLKDGRAVVAVEAPFGLSETAVDIMDTGECVDTDRLLRYHISDPSPFSDALGIPTLSSSKATNSLTSSNWSLSSSLGFGLLSNNPAPLSSIISWRTLSKPKSKGEWKRSFGFPLLSRKAAPFSSMFGMGTLSKPSAKKNTSFGFPMLSRTGAPLSRMFGLKVLSDTDNDRP
ncbi:MAG: hypothetical protein AAGD34_10865 [Pseudomonadota bacterium]